MTILLVQANLSSGPEESWALWLTHGDEKRLGPATTLYGTVALSFVIPSEADLSRLAVEGSSLAILPD